MTNRGRPRITTPGPVLQDAPHGTRRGYNLGCRCIPCRRSNAEGKARWRATKRTPVEEKT